MYVICVYIYIYIYICVYVSACMHAYMRACASVFPRMTTSKGQDKYAHRLRFNERSNNITSPSLSAAVWIFICFPSSVEISKRLCSIHVVTRVCHQRVRRTRRKEFRLIGRKTGGSFWDVALSHKLFISFFSLSIFTNIQREFKCLSHTEDLWFPQIVTQASVKQHTTYSCKWGRALSWFCLRGRGGDR